MKRNFCVFAPSYWMMILMLSSQFGVSLITISWLDRNDDRGIFGSFDLTQLKDSIIDLATTKTSALVMLWARVFSKICVH